MEETTEDRVKAWREWAFRMLGRFSLAGEPSPETSDSDLREGLEDFLEYPDSER